MSARNWLWAALVALLAVVGFAGWFWHDLSNSHELGSKPEWSELQGLSFEHRNSSLKENVVVEEESYGKRYWVLGVAGKNGSPNIWVLLNSSYEPYYKQLPEGNYQLDAATLVKVLATGKVHPIVAKELAARVVTK